MSAVTEVAGSQYLPLRPVSVDRVPFPVRSSLTAERARELLHYEPATGIFTRLVALSNKSAVGSPAGTLDSKGYVRISVLGTKYRGHWLAWLMHFGAWPSKMLDHRNGDRADNRIDNLREASGSMNSQNLRKACFSKRDGLPLGVAYMSGKLIARIREPRGAQRVIGRGYATPEDAHAAYLEAKRAMHEGCTL